jgi:hypothetical protein
MARDGHGQGVRPAGLGHRPDCLRGTNVTGDVGIARRCARRNLPQGLPDALLEGSPLHIEGQSGSQRRRFDQTDHLRDELLELGVPADQIGLREPVLYIVYEPLWIITQ